MRAHGIAAATLAVAAGLIGAVAAPASGAVQARAEPAPQAANSELLPTPVTQSVLSPPRWYPGDDGRVHMQYELMLINTIPTLRIDVTSLEVRGAHGRLIEALSGERLRAAMTLLGNDPEPPTTELPGATVGVVWVDLSFASRRKVPRQVKHRLTVDVGPGLPVGPAITHTGGRATVASRGPVAIAPPVLGDRWGAVGGPQGPHRRALQAVNGQLHLGQRFAVDFSARLDAQDRTYIGNPDQNSSYFAYGQPLVAVGSGKVVEAVDGLPDQVPNQNVPVPLADGDGNHVILKLGRRVFAAYGHMIPGSVRVERGERVRTGQVLGKLGNSGATSGPHLHFQLMNRPSVLDADGLPFVFKRFRLDGRIPSLEAFVDADREGTPVPIDASTAGERRRRGITGVEVVALPRR